MLITLLPPINQSLSPSTSLYYRYNIKFILDSPSSGTEGCQNRKKSKKLSPAQRQRPPHFCGCNPFPLPNYPLNQSPFLSKYSPPLFSVECFPAYPSLYYLHPLDPFRFPISYQSFLIVKASLPYLFLLSVVVISVRDQASGIMM